MSEYWKPLKHQKISDGYMISSVGRIKSSIDDLIPPYDPLYHSTNGYDYSLFVIKDEYRLSSSTMLFPIDILVGITFLSVDETLFGKDLTIIHLDGNTRNNNVENLKWVEDHEEWKPIVHNNVCPNMYEVSNKGNVRKEDTHEPCILHTNSHGYIVVHLKRPKPSDAGNMFCTHSVHRLVAEAFIDNSDCDVVNHIDGNPFNNHFRNLEYVTNQQNVKHAMITGLKKTISTETLDMVREMIDRYKYPRIVYENIDHEKYPEVNMNLIINLRRKWYYNRSNIDKEFDFHIGKMTTDEIDMVRDCILSSKNHDCKEAYEKIDHDKYPHITFQMVKEIKTNKYSSYNRSNKYDLNTLKFIKTPHPCKLSDVEIDMLRDILVENGGNVLYTHMQIKQDFPHISVDMIADLKRGKSYRRSNKYDLTKSYKYPFTLKEEYKNENFKR